MDYAAGDISRPAAVPGWTGIDFSSTPPGPGQAWLNRAALNPRHFSDYHQTLDLHEGTLTTRYTYLDRGRETGVEVTTLAVSYTHLDVYKRQIQRSGPAGVEVHMNSGKVTAARRNAPFTAVLLGVSLCAGAGSALAAETAGDAAAV